LSETTHEFSSLLRMWKRGLRHRGCGRAVSHCEVPPPNPSYARKEVTEVQSLAIVLMCVAAAVCYGIAHDQVTARVCVEYFTVGHPPAFGTQDPTLLGIGWGIIATWWVGLLLGVPLAIVARAGSRPKQSVLSLFRPLTWLLAVMAVCA